ncbi:MAG: D-inositol-3-phosphate glycosyltransferase [Chroococcopsis gigantea SAG 12.99]|jgi:glycosyltransferase involved in cell wall biosynthesis|nr:D-inositol-3-phosphate glycosyltransferase [Chroococcopsis gigantea SAG 12.99]
MTAEPLLINLSVLFSKPTGISTYILNLIPHLKFLAPTLLTPQLLPDFNCYEIPKDLTPFQGAKGHAKRLLWTQLSLGKIYRQLRSSLLFSPLPEAPLGTHCNFVVMVHDLIPLRFPGAYSPLTYYFRYYVPRVLQQSRAIICNSRATADDIVNFFSIPAAKIHPIPLAYDSDHFRPLNLPVKPYFLYVGRFNPHKNLIRLINAFGAIKNYRDHELILAGTFDPRYTPRLQQQVKEKGLENNVRFLDYIPYEELPVLINQALALVFPSLWEGFGLPPLEAMGCGTPVITSNLSSLPEVTSDAGILVNPYKEGEITVAMESLIIDSSLREHLSRCSIDRASQFSWEKTGRATSSVLGKFLT